MIFVTVGYQMPFDRLVRAVDEWAAAHPDVEIFAQIGPTEYRPTNLPFREFMDPEEFGTTIARTTAIVAHAGMGSILTALQHGKPIVVMPRRAEFQETRNDHQVATTRRFVDRPGIEVAADEHELPPILDRLVSLREGPRISSDASPELIARLRRFVEDVR